MESSSSRLAQKLMPEKLLSSEDCWITFQELAERWPWSANEGLLNTVGKDGRMSLMALIGITTLLDATLPMKVLMARLTKIQDYCTQHKLHGTLSLD